MLLFLLPLDPSSYCSLMNSAVTDIMARYKVRGIWLLLLCTLQGRGNIRQRIAEASRVTACFSVCVCMFSYAE